jgi:hypothetical protein
VDLDTDPAPCDITLYDISHSDYVIRCIAPVTGMAIDSLGAARGEARDMEETQRRSDEGEPDPSFLVLICMADAQARRADAIIEDTERLAGVRVSPDALRRALAHLARRGLIEPLPTEDPRQPYRISGGGAEIIRDELLQLAELARNRLHTGNRSVPLPFRPGELGQDAVMGSYEAPYPLYRRASSGGGR